MPRPSTEASVAPGINDPYFENPDVATWAQRFETEQREVFAHRDEILDDLRVRPGMTVADIGSGTGLFTIAIARALRDTGVVMALDILPAFLDETDARAEREGLTNVRTIRSREDSVDLPPEILDLAFVCDTYHHFEYPQAMLRSIYRALRPGGRLVVIDFELLPGPRYGWLVEHVRVDRETVDAEILRAGFVPSQLTPRAGYLRENYWLEYRKPDSRKEPTEPTRAGT
ncbi:MAG: class I SAM-dependent methyltransferase [Phycisphaerae bacterium]